MSSTSSLLIRQYEIGPLNNFLYLLGDPATKEMTVVDPAWDVGFLCREAQRLEYKITQVFLTHAHNDHVNGLAELLGRYQVPVYISKHEAPFLTAQLPNLTKIADRTELNVGGISVQTLHAPGHTPGCQCFFFKDAGSGKPAVLSGDVLFIDGCGRCDLPGSDPWEMYKSLSNVIMKLPDETVVYPGHNYGPTPTDTIGNQKQTNPYLQCGTQKEFLTERMGL